MTEPVLCRNWTEPDVRAAIALADDDQLAILREIVSGPPVLLRDVATRLGEPTSALQSQMQQLARKTNKLGILDPKKGTPSWPWTYERRPGGNAYVVPERVREIMLEEVADLPRHRFFVTLWAQGQIELMRSASAAGRPLSHTAGEQFERAGIRPGDRVYVVGTERGDLLLVGRLTVSELLDDAEARRRLKDPDLYEATGHLVGSGTSMAFDRRVPRGTVEQLERFGGKPISRPGGGGAVTGNSLRTTGRITSASAALLDALLVETFDVALVEPEDEVFAEGARRTALQTQIERSTAARDRAIEIHGTDCMACGFSFEAAYGAIGRGYAEVHHLAPVASAGVRTIDPGRDLAVLCANCHRMVHRREPPLEIDELKQVVDGSRGV